MSAVKQSSVPITPALPHAGISLAGGHLPFGDQRLNAAGTTLCAGHCRLAFHSRIACANNLLGDHSAGDNQRRSVAEVDAGQPTPDAQCRLARVSFFALRGKRRAIRGSLSKNGPRGEIFRHHADQHAPYSQRGPVFTRACSAFTTKSNREETTWM